MKKKAKLSELFESFKESKNKKSPYTPDLPISFASLSAGLIFAEGQELTHQNKEALWDIFQAIGYTWNNTIYDSNNQRSSWHEMLKAKTENAPNYTGEYVNAIYVMKELYQYYPGIGEIIYKKAEGKLYRIEEEDIKEGDVILRKKWQKEAFEQLFFHSGIDNNLPPTTRYEHCKIYVVNEFIRMQVVAGAFKSWGTKNGGIRARNYGGYLGGSRYNESHEVREYNPSATTLKNQTNEK